MEKASKKLVTELEADFLVAYYGKASVTRLDRRASAITAGYTPRMALWNANRLLKKYAERSFKQCAEAVGINKPQLAVMFREILETSEGRDAISSIRLMMANLGEQTDSAGSQKNINVNAPTMIIVGATQERMDALKRGGTTQIAKTAERVLELQSAAYEEAIDAETAIEQKSEPNPEPKLAPAEDSRRLNPSDFAGRNLGPARI
jgi:hypothetical protein